MILQALARYYDILLADPESDMAPPGYSSALVSFALVLSLHGELTDILPLFQQVQVGSKLVERPLRKIVPEQVKRSSGINPNFLCENSAYMLGLTEKGGEDFGSKRFTAFRDFHNQRLSNVASPAARAVLSFLNNYDPKTGREHPVIKLHLEELLKGGNLVFLVDGHFVHEEPTVRLVWDKYKSNGDSVIGQCMVTGEIAPIARLHPSLKGIRDANPTGASIVSFNERSYESFNKTKLQGLNAPVSEKAVFAYTTALNYLLSSANPNKKIILGDSTVVYWAESEKKEFANAFESIFEPPIVEEELPVLAVGHSKTEKGLKDVAQKVIHVQKLDLAALLYDLRDENPRFYVLALAPNAARVSVRFFLTDPFQKIVDRMMQHYRDLEIVKEYDNQPDYITVHRILDETVSKKARDQQASPLMAGTLFRSILSGLPYPAALFYAIINRVRADSDGSGVQKIGYTRAAIIKAFLIRKYSHQPDHPIQEVLKMSLNEQSNHPAYVLGRLFAVLEKVQQEAIGDPNAGIRDRYFTSACASPASTFPVLLRLSQHHISKAQYGYAMDHRILQILDLLEIEKNPIPSRLTLDEQGVFILGYYHQRASFFVPQKDKSVINKPTSEIVSSELN